MLCHPASCWRELGWRQLSRNTEPLIIGRGGGHTASHCRLDGQVVRGTDPAVVLLKLARGAEQDLVVR